ncbi:conserved hypothetical protein [Tenacibaculum sp. 190524A02b]|uniref:Tail sheath protein subtilisin-like domain-containing protein n=1 Tax=Tenacibaculum vairaonense TaxID=3137860 RepID=A0ABM9PQX0_9FLAO
MKGLPKVDIQINPNSLGSTLQTADGIAAMVLTGVAISGKVELNIPLKIISLKDAENKGITKTGGNSFAYAQIEQFYSEAGNGAILWLMLVGATITKSKMVSKNEPYAKRLLQVANPPIKLLAISKKVNKDMTLANGVDADVDKAIKNAQELVESFLPHYKECNVIVDVNSFNRNHTDLKDYNTATDAPYVSPLISSVGGSENACVGLFLGRLAKDPVQRNPARVKSGRLPIENASLTDGNEIASHEFLDAIHNKGYNFIRSFAGKAGYFFSDAQTCAKATSDLNSIPNVRVITKARSIAYLVFVDEIMEEIPVTTDGKIAQALVKAWQAKIETSITKNMVAKGEVSGVSMFIDTNQDIIGTGTINGVLSIQPVGYAKYINIKLGFTKTL